MTAVIRAEIGDTKISTSADNLAELDWALNHIREKCMKAGILK